MKVRLGLVVIATLILVFVWFRFSERSDEIESTEIVKGYATGQEICHKQFEKFCRGDFGYVLPESFKVFFDKSEMPESLVVLVSKSGLPFDGRDNYRFIVTQASTKRYVWIVEKGKEPRLVE